MYDGTPQEVTRVHVKIEGSYAHQIDVYVYVYPAVRGTSLELLEGELTIELPRIITEAGL